MIQRMEKAYIDLSYLDHELVKKYETSEIKVNKDAATLVIACINKIYQILLTYGFSIYYG